MHTSNRIRIAKEVQTRLNAGESKASIYHAMKNDNNAMALERTLAQWPTRADKEKNRFINVPLLIIAIVFALATLIQFIGIVQNLAPIQALSGILTILIFLFGIYGIKNYNLLGYLLLILMSLGTLMSAHAAGTFSPMPVALAVAAIVLALIQKRRLFPKTTFLLKHKKDSSGNIIF